MPKMTAAEAAVRVMEREGVDMAFGIPGAAINPLYAALRRRGSITHILARHVEGASHMAEGYTRAVAGNIGVCIGTSGPAGTDMITGLYSASADSIPILCITGQAPRARMHKEDFQAVDIASIAKPVAKWAVTVMEPAQVPRAFQQAFHLMRSGRPGPVLIDLPFDVQMGEIEFDDATYAPLPVYKPNATLAQIEKAMAMLNEAERPLIVAGGGIINADASRPAGAVRRDRRRAGHSDADGLGHHPRRPSAHGRHGRAADFAPLRQCHDAGRRLRARHRQPLGQPPHRLGRRVHEGPQVRARGHRAHPDRARVQPGLWHRLGCQGRAGAVRAARSRMEGGRQAQGPQRLGGSVPRSQGIDRVSAQDQLREQADEAAARVSVHEQRVRQGCLLREHHRPVADRRGAVPARLQAAPLDQLRPGRAAGLDGARRARAFALPTRRARSSRSPATTTSSS